MLKPSSQTRVGCTHTTARVTAPERQILSGLRRLRVESTRSLLLKAGAHETVDVGDRNAAGAFTATGCAQRPLPITSQCQHTASAKSCPSPVRVSCLPSNRAARKPARRSMSAHRPQPVRIGGLTRWQVADLIRAVDPTSPPTTASAPGADRDIAPGCTPREPHQSPGAQVGAR